MELHIHLHHEYPSEVTDKLNLILHNQNQLKMTQAELAQQLNDLNTELAKVNTEVQGKLQELADALANSGNVSPEVEAALGNLKTAIQGVDDLIPDTPVE